MRSCMAFPKDQVIHPDEAGRPRLDWLTKTLRIPLPIPFRLGQRGRYTASMHTAQAGIFALGTSSHVYLEFDLVDEKQWRDLAAAVAANP
jgi:hypothetical protein